MSYDYKRIYGTDAPESMTMDRLGELDELVVAQTTQMCFRQGCCRPSINWVLLDSSDYDLDANRNPSSRRVAAATNPFDLPSVGGWIHEEATFFQRFCCTAPGCRETRFVHHAGTPPESLGDEDCHCCVIQTGPTSNFLKPHELSSSIVAVHEKSNTCPTGCCCGHQPYLRTMDAQGRFLGETQYVCDECIFVPKFLVLDEHRQPRFLLRPDTCCGDACVRPRCGGRRGKCLRLPFLVRDPTTKQPLGTNQTGSEEAAQVTSLWSGLANEVCFRRHAYHVAFPAGGSLADKLVLIGASVLVDVALFEQEDDK